MTPREPTADQQRLLQAVFDRFSATAEWPDRERLQWELDRDGVDLDIKTIGQGLDPAWGRVGSGHRESVSLTVHGLARCEGSSDVLDDLLACVRLALERRASLGPGVRLTSDDLGQLFTTDVLRTRRAFALLQLIVGIGGGSGAPVGEWYREITEDIRRYRDVATPADLVARMPHVRAPWLDVDLSTLSPTVPAAPPPPTRIRRSSAGSVPRAPELVPASVRIALRNAVGGTSGLKLRQIDDFFEMEEFHRTADFAGPAEGDRRQRAEAFHAEIDFGDPAQAGRYLRVIARVLDAIDIEDRQDQREALLRELQRAGIDRDAGGRLVFRSRILAPDAVTVPDASDIRMHLDRLSRLDQEPEEQIGAAKELVEATAKYVLLALGLDVPKDADVPHLSKLALERLRLHPTSLAPSAKGADVTVRILGGLGHIASGLGELRNMGYGTGHGHGRRTVGLRRRHGELAARAAVAYAAFLLATLDDPDAPWHRAAQPAETESPAGMSPSDEPTTRRG